MYLRERGTNSEGKEAHLAGTREETTQLASLSSAGPGLLRCESTQLFQATAYELELLFSAPPCCLAPSTPGLSLNRCSGQGWHPAAHLNDGTVSPGAPCPSHTPPRRQQERDGAAARRPPAEGGDWRGASSSCLAALVLRKEGLGRRLLPWVLLWDSRRGHVRRRASPLSRGWVLSSAAQARCKYEEMSAQQADEEPAGAAHPPLLKLLSAFFYGTCSFLIVLVNKTVLTTYRFPSPMVLGIGQMATTILILYVSKLNKIIHFPDFDKSIPMKLFPLPLLYVGNHISGLTSTSKLSLPMFTVLRKFTIPLTLLLEIIILGKRYSLGIIVSVFAIVLGAFIAAGSDLSFTLEGYTFVLLNDIFTAANGVYTKQKMDPKELGTYGVLFYNAYFMVIPTMILSFSTGDLQQVTDFKHWTNFLFLFQFLLSCFLGFLLTYSVVLCSHYNSALTTSVVGAFKNISIAYIGMLVGGDYIFSILNFIGLNICMAGGLRYSFLILRDHKKPKQPTDEENMS
ncbi:unnamed protein product [Caretta caretta]